MPAHGRLPSRLLLALAALLLSCLQPRAQGDPSNLIKELRTAQRDRGSVEAVEARTRAARALEPFATVAVAKALVAAYEQSEAEMAELRARESELADAMAKLVAGQEHAKQRVLPAPALAAYNEARDEMAGLRKMLGAYIDLQDALRELVRELDETETLEWLVEDVVASRKRPLPLRVAGAEAMRHARDDVDVVEPLLKQLGRARKDPDMVVLAAAVEAVGRNAASAASDLLDMLEEKDPTVRTRAARALAALGVVEAVEPLIALLEEEREDPRQRDQIAAALAALTGQRLGPAAGVWRSWWEANSESVRAGEQPLGGGAFELPKSDAKGSGYYFDIPQDGKSIFYVIDASGSMEAEIDLKTTNAKEDGDGGSNRGTRLEACKKELISALKRLKPDQEFNMLWYSELVFPWQETMQKATPGNVRKAVDWIEELGPAGSTNIYGAMQKTFEFTGRGARDKYYGIAFDTVFLLTDGTPTLPTGEPDSTEKILKATRGWNSLGRVRIHCIGIGNGINTAFLQKLASENGGEFRRY